MSGSSSGPAPSLSSKVRFFIILDAMYAGSIAGIHFSRLDARSKSPYV